MRAITLTQPWATLVAIGAKRIETRSWRTSYRGPLAIHAGKGLAGMSVSDYAALCRSLPHFGPVLRSYYPKAGVMLRDERGRLCHDDPLPRGAIVAVGFVVACQPTDSPDVLHGGGWTAVGDVLGPWPLTEQERAFGDYTPGRWAWLLADVQRLPEPVPCKGALGLWTVPAEVEAQIRAQIGG